MTSAKAPARRGALARGWRDFRRWRRGRPFWGGLLTLLAGIEIFASTQLTLGDLQLKVGLEGFQSYVIPASLVLAGLLVWFTPAQRIFYGVLAALISVYSLIGVNLGGFFLGMLLGVLGGSLAASWTPVRLPPQPAAVLDETADLDRPTGVDDGRHAEIPREQPDATVDELLTGPLTDVLPPATTSPIPQPRPARESPVDETDDAERPRWDATDPRWDAGGEETPPPGGPLPRRSPRLFAITLVPVALAAATVAALPASPPSLADPCPSKPSATGTAKPSATSNGAPVTASGAAEGGGLIGAAVGEAVGAVGDVLGAGGESEPAPTASPEPTASPATEAAPTATATPAPTSTRTAWPDPAPTAGPTQSASSQVTPKATTPSPCASGATTPTEPQIIAADPDPTVAKRSARMTGTRLSMTGLSYRGVAELKTGDGTTVRVLSFAMRSATIDGFELRIPQTNGTTTLLKSTVLTVQENVAFYTYRFKGTLGEDEVTFTPDFPPQFTDPQMSFTDPDIQLVFVSGDALTAEPMSALLVS